MYVSAIAILALCSCQSNVVRHSAKEKAPVKVETITVSSSASLSRHSYMGEVVPSKSVTLLAPYSGTVQSILVSKGSVVEKGAVTAVISSQPVESAYQIAQASLKQAQDGYDRVSLVYSSGVSQRSRWLI